MNSLIALLCIVINSSFVKDTDYRIALFIIEHLYEMEQITLNEMAEKCYTSVNTLKKFFRMMGDRDLAMLKFHVRNSISVRLGQMQARYSESTYEETLNRIRAFYPEINDARLNEVIQKINKAIEQCDRVIILGAAFPNALAVNYQEDMIIMHKPVIMAPAVSSLTGDFDEIRENDFVILTTISGSFFSVYPKRREAVMNLSKLAVITGENTDLSAFKDAIEVCIPMQSDDEKYNWFLLGFFQLLKTDYYQNHILNAHN